MSTSADELSLGELQELMSAAAGDRPAIRWRDRTVTHEALTRRTRRLANAFVERGLGAVVPRAELEPWECGQDFVALLSRNRPEFLEVMFGAFKARCVPYNVNYRYGPSEVRELIASAPTRSVVYEVEYSGLVDAVRGDLASNVVLIEIGGGDAPSVDGAIAYESLIAESHETTLPPASPDDLYVVFTGGTTGRPKAVMWRQADAAVSALHGPTRGPGDQRPIRQALVDHLAPPDRVVLAAPPFMHGGGQWVALGSILEGGTVAIQHVVDRLDCADVWSTVERERVRMMLVTGNAFGVPLVDELRRTDYDLASLRILLTGAVAMTDDVKAGLIDAIPGLRIVETIGATESGTHLRNVTSSTSSTGRSFTASADSVVLDDTRQRRLGPGEGPGWLARSGRIPLGYLGDKDRTLETWPTIDGVRYSVPGDRAAVLPSGELEFLGRDSVTINTGGEKVFAEEVERALVASPEVYDVVVAGRPHPRWGQEVVAFVSLRPGADVSAEALRERVGEQLARYKVPKRIEFTKTIPRNDIGKPDYAWAHRQAAALEEQP